MRFTKCLVVAFGLSLLCLGGTPVCAQSYWYGGDHELEGVKGHHLAGSGYGQFEGLAGAGLQAVSEGNTPGFFSESAYTGTVRRTYTKVGVIADLGVTGTIAVEGEATAGPATAGGDARSIGALDNQFTNSVPVDEDASAKHPVGPPIDSYNTGNADPRTATLTGTGDVTATVYVSASGITGAPGSYTADSFIRVTFTPY